MHEPKHVWGIYAVQGAVVVVRLQRAGEKGIEIESAYLEANDGRTLPLHVASTLLARPVFRGEPAVVALPDSGGFLATVRVPAERAGQPVAPAGVILYGATRFAPGHAELRHALVAREGGDQVYLVAAVKRSAVAAALHEFEPRRPHPGVASGGAATIRGARSLGLCPDRCVLVEVEPHVTIAYLVDHAHVQRRIVPFGAREIAHDSAHGKTLAGELRQLADERPDSAAAESPVKPAPFLLVGPGAASSAVRQRLAEALGDRLVGGRIADGRVRADDDGRLHHLPPAALAGAVGAALEAFEPVEGCLLFHGLPDTPGPHVAHAPRPWVAAAATSVAAAAFGIWLWSRPGEPPAAREIPATPETEPGPRHAPVPSEGRPPLAPEAPAVPATETVPPGPPAPREAAGPPSTAPTARPADLRVEAIGPARVRVSWPEGREGRVLRRFGASWKDLATVGAGAGSIEDEVPGATQLYGWRLDDGNAVFAQVEVPVDVEVAGPAGRGGARFVLRRAWRGTQVRVTMEVAPGEPIRTISPCGDPPTDLTFDTGCSLVGVHTKVEREKFTARVPHFQADGRVERGADQSPVSVERTLERDRRVFEAMATTGDGKPLTWTHRDGGE